MAAPDKRRRIVSSEQKDDGARVSFDTCWRVLLCSNGVFTGYDRWDRGGTFPRVSGSQLVVLGYTDGAAQWNAHQTRPIWVVPLDAPFEVAAITIKGRVARRTWQEAVGAAGAWVGNTAYTCGSETATSEAPLVRMSNIETAMRSTDSFGRLDGDVQRRVPIPRATFHQRPVEITLWDEGYNILSPHILARPIGAEAAGLAHEVFYMLTITLHEASRSHEDKDAWT